MPKCTKKIIMHINILTFKTFYDKVQKILSMRCDFMLWTVDRIEEDFAVIETPSGMINIELKFLPEGIAEGNIISLNIDISEEEKTTARIKEKMNRLFKD